MNDQPLKREALQEQQIGDELYVFTGDNEALIVMNAVATIIWSLCDGTHTAEQMALTLADLYPAMDADELLNDVREILQDFQESGFLASD